MTPSFADDPQSHELPFDPGLLDRYFAGEATAEECEAVCRWVSGHPDRAAHLDVLRCAPSASPPPPPLDVDTFWTTVEARTTALPDPVVQRARRAATPSRPWRPGVGGGAGLPWVAIAASILVALGVGLTVGSVRHGSHSAWTGHEYATAAGQRLSVVLLDGTQLTLAPASRLRVAADYANGGARSREVELEGEAYFAVAHDSAHPFAVRTRHVVARDVGTAFDVRAYPEEPAVRVVVMDGAVSLGNAIPGRGTRHLLSSGMLGDVDRGGVTHVTAGVDVERYRTWISGRLTFHDTPLRDVARALSRWYDLDVQIADSSLGGRILTTTFGDEPIEEVLQVVAGTMDVRVQRMGRTVVVSRVPSVR